MKDIESSRKKYIVEESFIPHKNYRSYIGNNLLYDLCKTYPNTVDFQEVHAKIWIIGRSYAVALERTKRNKVDYESFSKSFIEWNKKVGFDNRLYNIKDEKDALEVYKLLLDFVYSETGQYKRSFVSKYLHFHRPEWFKLYDSHTRKSLTYLSTAKSNVVGKIDSVYADFCAKENDVRDYIKEKFGKQLDNRDLDIVLIYIYEHFFDK